MAEAEKQRGKRSGMFFEPPSRLQQADKLSHLIRYSDFLLLVIGVEGSGKTTLLERIAPSDPQDTTLVVCRLSPDGAMDTPALLAALLQQLPNHSNHAAGDQAGQLQGLHEQVSAMRALGQRLLLLVDDAHLLSTAALALLLNFLAAGNSDGTAPQLLLLGEPALEETLRQGQLLDGLEGRLHNTVLAPYRDEEAREFLQLRYPTLRTLPKKQLDRLLEQAAGVPGKLDSGALTLLRIGKTSVTGSARAFPFPPLHLAGILLVLLAITVVAAWQFMPAEETERVAESVDRVEIALKLPAATAVANAEAQAARSQLEQRLQAQEARMNRDAAAAQTAEAARLAKAEPAPKLPEPGNGALPPAATELAPQAAVNENAGPVAQTMATQQQAPADLPADTARVAVPVRPQPLATKAEPVVEAVVAESPNVEAVPAATYGREAELLQWPAAGYTLQMLGARDARSVSKFLQAQSEPELFYSFSTLYKGRPWYVVVYGRYPSRNAAAAAILPPALKQLRPWARSVQGVQDDIRKK